MVDELSEEEKKDFQLAFNLFDKERTGQIAPKTLGSIMRSLGQNPTESELQEMVNEVDVDGNGTIDFDEFLIIMAKTPKDNDSEDKLIEAFKVFDPETTGELNVPQLRDILANLGQKFSEEDINQLIKDADPKEEGTVQIHDFVKMINK